MYHHMTLAASRRAKQARKQFPVQATSSMTGCQAFNAGHEAAIAGAERKVPGDVYRAGVAVQWYKGYDKAK